MESDEKKSQERPWKSDRKQGDKKDGDKEKIAEQDLSMAMLEMMTRLEITTRKCWSKCVTLQESEDESEAYNKETRNVGTMVWLDMCEEIFLKDLQDPLHHSS